MSTTTEEIKITLKFLVDKERKKVIFAEAESDFVDTLFSFLTFPMGTITRLLREEKPNSQLVSIGSLSSLYEGLLNLDPKYFWTAEYCKNMLLKPINSSESECHKLKVNVDDTEPSKYFICENWRCSRGSSCFFSPFNIARCNCGKPMNREIGPRPRDSKFNIGRDKSGVFVTETTSFIITDDLRIMPNLPSFSIELLNGFGIEDMTVLEEKIVRFGAKEFLYLLKGTLISKTPLTDVFYGKKPIIDSEQVDSCLARSDHIKTTTSSLKKMTLKLIVLKSTKKVLFGQAEEDFVDFIFGFLAVPLGRVVHLLSVNTSLGCVDNLYKSILNHLIAGRHMRSCYLKNKLISPCLASLYLCKNGIFSLNDETTTSQLYCSIKCNSGKYDAYLASSEEFFFGDFTCSALNLKDPKLDGGFVRGPAMFMVTDDLVVLHLSSITAISFLNRMKIPFSDVEEQVVSVGTDEALSILKASLHSKSALTNGLNLFVKKPKEES